MEEVAADAETAFQELKPAEYSVRLPEIQGLFPASSDSISIGDGSGAEHVNASKASEAFVRKLISVVRDQFELLDPDFLREVRRCVKESLRDPDVSGIWNVESCLTEQLAECTVRSCNAARLYVALCTAVNERNFSPRYAIPVGAMLSALLPLNARPDLIERLRQDTANGVWFVETLVGSSTLAELIMAGREHSKATFAVSERASDLTGKHAVVWEAPPKQNPSDTEHDERVLLLAAIDILLATEDELERMRPGKYRKRKLPLPTALRAHELANSNEEAIRNALKAVGKQVREALQSNRESFQRDCYCIVRLPDDDELLKSYLKKAIRKAVDEVKAMVFLEISSQVSREQPDFSRLNFMLATSEDES